MNAIIEICAGSVESVYAARKGGAGRIELCSALSEGGLTPSQGLIEYAVTLTGIETMVLIRPRSGDFHYTRAEYGVMKSDVFAAKARGASGIVAGMLNSDGSIDTCRMKELIEMARPMKVTFHRAFDMCRDPFRALEDIIEMGCERILTSGQAATAFEGTGLIAQLVEQAGGRIIIMPGSGINAGNLAEIARKTGTFEFHLSAGQMVGSRMSHRKEAVSMGKVSRDEYGFYQTDAGLVREAVEIARSLFV